MRQIYLQKEFYHLAKKPIIRPSGEAKQRERLLSIWERLCEQGLSREAASKVLGVSRASLYRWKQRLELEGWKGWNVAAAVQNICANTAGARS